MTAPIWSPTSKLAQKVFDLGFIYATEDPDNPDPTTWDFIYSRQDAWQRGVGYSWAYDKAAPLSRMILDCEPLYFTYDGKQWLIELWKGQYVIECGGEIGVYNREDNRWHRFIGRKHGLFGCANDADRLEMKFTIIRSTSRNAQVFITRGPDLHWWLTGFKWGEFSQPEELTMTATITLKDAPMKDAFVGALTDCGYPQTKFKVTNNTVEVTFDKPYTAQPWSRWWHRDKAQGLNDLDVKAYQKAYSDRKLTSHDPNLIDKIEDFPGISTMLESWLAWIPPPPPR